MFSWMKDFLYRHKRKFFMTGALVGGTYLVGKVVKWKLDEWREREAEELVNQSRKQYHFECNQRTCCMTFMSFLPTLRDNIVKKLNVESLTEELKSNPSNKLEIWETLKMLICTRTIASVISVCILHVYLKVQMNVIGGYMFLDYVVESNEHLAMIAEAVGEDSSISTCYKPKKSSHEIQKQYLNNVRYLLEKGIYLLIDNLEEQVKGNYIIDYGVTLEYPTSSKRPPFNDADTHQFPEILGGVPLKQKLSHYELSRFIFQIWEKLKSRKCTYASKLDFVKEKENDECVPVKKNAEANSVSVFSSYMLDHSMFDEGLDCDGIDDVTKYKKIMAETVDILENEDCLTVVFECIKKGLEQLLVNLEPFFLSQEEDPEAIIPADQNETVCKKLNLPFAKILPLVNAQINEIFKSGRNDYLDVIFGVQSTNDFAANIYESFSSECGR